MNIRRSCTHCKVVIRSHVWVVDNRDFCGKGCICRHLGHRPKDKYCNGCRGPQVPKSELDKYKKRKLVRR